MPARAATLLCALALTTGCGSGVPLPPAAEPAQSPPLAREPAGRVVPAGGRRAAVPGPSLTARLEDGTEVRLDPRRRRLHAGGQEAPAGLGPTQVVVGADDRIYVTDTDGGSVLLFRHGEELKLVRRAAVPGKPYATALDRERGRLWVTVTERNEVVQVTADGAPRIRRRFATVRQPNAIAVDPRRGTVRVLGAGGRLQAFDADLD